MFIPDVSMYVSTRVCVPMCVRVLSTSSVFGWTSLSEALRSRDPLSALIEGELVASHGSLFTPHSFISVNTRFRRGIMGNGGEKYILRWIRKKNEIEGGHSTCLELTVHSSEH